jgi:alkanesulfonate monooxygenase SsuD/methylene tetrahydromethanopterin reductase-like flavin-dependent oxidoreductase (luciferase family)
MGLHLPETVERFERLAELLELARRMWDGDDSAFTGKHLRLAHPIGSPRPDHRLPVLIGGAGERRTLRLVAEYADACNLFDIPDGGQTIQRKLDVLQRHCVDAGRSYQQIERTVTTAFDADSVASLTDRCIRLHELGIQSVVLITRGRPWTSADCDIVTAAAERLADVR